MKLDLLGDQFGRWTVIAEADTRRGARYLLCRCTCGNEAEVAMSSLRSGHSRSCGCLASDMTRERWSHVNLQRAELAVGQRFGQLTVCGEPVLVDGLRRYPVKCDCGRERMVRGDSLITGFVKGTCRCPKDNRGYRKAYAAWWSARDRCTNPNAQHWANYGGRGVTMCSRWAADGGFEAFLEDMGEPPAGLSLDRIDNDRGYEPGNCRWATARTQARNTRNFKLSPERVRQVLRLEYSGHSNAEIARITGLNEKTVSVVLVVAEALTAAG